MFVLAGLLLCGLIVGILMLLKSVSPVEAYDPRGEVIRMAHNLVRSVIRPDLRTTFSSPAETDVETLTDKFHVSGWVNVVAENGSSSRHNYSCYVYRNPAGEWVGDHVSVIPQ